VSSGALPQTPSWIWGGEGKREEEGQGRKEERNTENDNPQNQNPRSATGYEGKLPF